MWQKNEEKKERRISHKKKVFALDAVFIFSSLLPSISFHFISKQGPFNETSSWRPISIKQTFLGKSPFQ
jgi:hypothetical protein